VHAVQHEPGFGEPLLELGNRRGAVIVEMRPRGEELHRFESVRRDLEQMVARQPLRVVKMRRHAELSFRHEPKHPFYRRLYRGTDLSPLVVSLSNHEP
jgi:hypothetical protein